MLDSRHSAILHMVLLHLYPEMLIYWLQEPLASIIPISILKNRTSMPTASLVVPSAAWCRGSSSIALHLLFSRMYVQRPGIRSRNISRKMDTAPLSRGLILNFTISLIQEQECILWPSTNDTLKFQIFGRIGWLQSSNVRRLRPLTPFCYHPTILEFTKRDRSWSKRAMVH